MRLLLDTHVLIWLVNEPARLSPTVTAAIKNPSSEVFVSAASAWEIATKVRLGKLAFDAAFLDDFDARLKALAFAPLLVTSAHAVAGTRLTGRHGDPFDRMLVGQALAEGLDLATADPLLAALGARVLW